MLTSEVTLSASQREVADALISSRSARMTLAGLAGTGKTTVSHYVYKEWVRQGLDVCVLAPSAKAAMVLRRKGVPATTIHSAIYRYRGQFEAWDGSVELIFKDNKSGRFCDRLIIDETSMVTCRQRDDIQERDIPSLWVGDPGQLKPVKSKPNGLLTRPDYTLTEIHRQAAGNPIIQFAYKMRRGEGLSTRHPGINHVSVSGKGPTVVASAMLDRNIDRLIVRRNDQRVAVNKSYRAILDRKGLVDVGDELICLMNNPYLGIVNGEIFAVEEVYERFPVYTTVRVASLDLGTRHTLSVWNDQFGQERTIGEGIDQCFALMDHAYAITCHKAQGSGWRSVGVASKGSDGQDDSKEWAYTAVTRAEEELTVFC
jgi:exodeoxyribonuclease V